MDAAHPSESACPCGRGPDFEACCAPYVGGARPAPDPESLMRSRYTAFALGTPAAVDYLVETHHPDHRSADLRAGLSATVDAVEAWVGLRVLEASSDGDRGTVEFKASYRVNGVRQELHERSQFVREGGRWRYTTGEIR